MPSLWQRIGEAAKAFRLGPSVVAADSSFSYTAKPDVRYGDLLEQSVGVYACANLRATTISSLPIIVYQATSDGQRERVTSGPVVDLLARVNPHWTFPHLLEMLELSLCLWGSAFLIVEKDGRGVPIELWWARPDKMTVVPHPTDYIAGYVYEQNEKKIAFQTDEVVWIRYPNPANEYAGLSPIASARMSVELGRAGLLANRKLFDQGLMAGGVISPSNPDTTWPADKVQQLQELLSRRMAGVDRAHRWMVIGHQMNAEPMGVSPRDAEFIEQMRLSLGDICRVFQVPPILVQDLEKGTYSNFEQSLKALWTLCLVPEAHRITHWLNEQLMPMFGDGLSVEFDFSGVAVLQEGQDAKWAREDGQIKTGAITVNEWRASRSMEPLPWGDQWWASAGLIPVGGDGQIDAETATRSFSGEEWKFGGIAHIAHWKRNDARVARQVTAFRGMVEDFLDEQAKRVVREMRKAEKAFSMTDPFDVEAESEALAARATPYIRRAVQVSGDGVWAELGLIGSFDVRSPLVTEFIRNRAQRFAVQVNETTWERLRTSLADGIDAGEGVDALARRVTDTMELRKNQSAETIARTEVGGADNGGALEAAKQSGVVSGKQWIAAIDNMTRDTHVAAHLETVPLDADFSLGGPAPGQIGDAAEDINCRCVMRFVTDLSGPQEP